MARYTQQIVAAVHTNIGSQDRWARWPGGWPDEISTSLIDAVFSARARYETSRGRGVLALVKQWRTKTTACDALDVLITEIDATGSAAWGAAFGSRAVSPGRQHRRPDDPTKAGAVREAAQLLSAHEIVHADEMRGNERQAQRLLQRVPGIGQATADYFLMLLGRPGVKADRMIQRFLRDTTGTVWLSATEAVNEIEAAAALLDVSVTDLEHAIWAWQRTQERSPCLSG